MNQDQFDDMMQRLIWIESKLCAFMESMGYDTYGRPVGKKVEHPNSLFEPKTVPVKYRN